MRRFGSQWSGRLPLLFLGRHTSRGNLEALAYYLTYIAPMLVFAPLLLASRLREPGPPRLWNAGIDLTAIGVAGSRMVAPVIPFSGHMVILVYALMSSRSKLLWWLALVLAAHTTYLKLVMWRDPITWIVGVAIGVALASVRAEPWWRTKR